MCCCWRLWGSSVSRAASSARVCARVRARALLDETQEERAEIVKVAVLFVIAVRRGGGKGEQKKTTTKGQKKNPFLGMHFFARHNIGFSGMLEIRAVGVK